jgi:hypothetical protein
MKLQSGGEQKPLVWGEEQEKAFRGFKRMLTSAPALGLPDVMKPFSSMSMSERGQLLGS